MENNIPNTNLEKTDIQKIALQFCMEKINSRLVSLGLDSREYNTDLVQYDDELHIATNHHSTDTDKTHLWFGNEANIRTILHELTHAIASERRYRTSDELKIETIKTGFSRGMTFRVLTEAVTEKIARELFRESYEENKNYIQPLFTSKSEEIIQTLNQRYEQIMSQRIEQIMNNQPPSYNYLDLIGMRVQADTLRRSYSIESKPDSYNEYVKLLEVMLECLVLEKSTDMNEYPGHLKHEWGLLQKAYFTGNSLYFKRVKKLFDRFGINLLRELEQYNGIDNDMEIVELTNKITGVKEQLLKKLETKSKINTSDFVS